MCSRVVLIRLKFAVEVRSHLFRVGLITFSRWCLSIIEQSPAFTEEKGKKVLSGFYVKILLLQFMLHP